jgi:tetratricopeptide (TPR) repeat protein
VQAKTRVVVLVGVAAVAAAGATVGVTALTSNPEPKRAAVCPAGPPLQLDLGVRTDPEAIALRRAQSRLAQRDSEGARRIFEAYRSIDAQVGAAIAAWPTDTLSDLEALAAAHSRNATVELNLGNALFCDREPDQARGLWRTAERLAPDSPIGIRAADLLNPRYPIPGIPVFVPDFRYPRGLRPLSPQRQLRELAARARRRDVRAKLLYGTALQKLGRQRSAEREFAVAAALASDDAEAQVAAAVGRFTKDRPAAAFSRLGPLARRFPQASTVRFHLGLLLLWLGQVRQASTEFRLAERLAPHSVVGKQAKRFLTCLSDPATCGSSP